MTDNKNPQADNFTTPTDYPVIKNPEITVLKEFRKLLTPLFAEEHKGLEESIRHEGLHKPLQIWVWEGKNVLVDGHNRYDICMKHKIDYYAHVVSFETKEAAKKWILTNQESQRNLTTFQRIEVVLKLKDIIAADAKKNQQASGGAVNSKMNKPVVKKINTYKILAERAGVSPNTVRGAEAILKKVAEEVIGKEELENLRRGKVKVGSIYKKYCATQPASKSATPKDGTAAQPNKPIPKAKPTPVQVVQRKLRPVHEQRIRKHLNSFDYLLSLRELQKEDRICVMQRVEQWLNKVRSVEEKKKK